MRVSVSGGVRAGGRCRSTIAARPFFTKKDYSIHKQGGGYGARAGVVLSVYAAPDRHRKVLFNSKEFCSFRGFIGDRQ
ncbi:hypothetical protein [Paraburkholderia ferrariae]|uniref:hypothetical protein n=1 Tax=Paraburkholderia ferrariae TaxID=386056 RepID=UPI0012EB0AD3|nr:hypothetical protein [Paraburkholderia ferrariae]